MDCTIVAFYSQSQLQLLILQDNLKHITDLPEGTNILQRENENFISSPYKDINYDEFFRKLLYKRLVRCVKHYDTITW